MIRAACYCRVSTEKDEQLESLEKQKAFFEEFVKSKGQELVGIYADEGISGKQLKNRHKFVQMIRDAEQKKFDVIYVKDISRFARNTEDFLHNIRLVKNIGLNIYFVTNNLNVQEANEFFLTVLAAMAQEESAKLSERVKFGKNITAQKGRVPNFVFGYDKIDRYTLIPNEQERAIIEKIFDLYVNEGYGTARIAGYLNEKGVITKKNKKDSWYQHVVSRILRNEIYIGKIVNKKSEVVDFITGKRRAIAKEDQIVVERPELQIISNEVFKRAQELLAHNADFVKAMNRRDSVKFPLSNLIKCSECGFSFRRCHRKYSENGKEYKWWTCSLRNAKGKDSCINVINVDEGILENAIKQFLIKLVSNKNKAVKEITRELKEVINKHNSLAVNNKKDIQKQINEVTKQKGKYMDMYKNEVISMEELIGYTKDINESLHKLTALYNIAPNIDEIEINIENVVSSYFSKLEEIAGQDILDNQFLKKIIQKIVVFPDGAVKVFLKVDGGHNLTFDMPLEAINIPIEKTFPCNNNST